MDGQSHSQTFAFVGPSKPRTLPDARSSAAAPTPPVGIDAAVLEANSHRRGSKSECGRCRRYKSLGTRRRTDAPRTIFPPAAVSPLPPFLIGDWVWWGSQRLALMIGGSEAFLAHYNRPRAVCGVTVAARKGCLEPLINCDVPDAASGIVVVKVDSNCGRFMSLLRFFFCWAHDSDLVT